MTARHPDELVSASDAIRIFGVARDQIALWESQRRLRGVRTLSGIRYHLAELTDLVHEKRDEDEHTRVEEQAAADARALPPPAPKPTRTAARRRALELLHAADVAGVETVGDVPDDVPYYARALVDGVSTHRQEIDEVIRSRAEHWTIDRMPVVDRNLLRLAIFELMWTDVPTGVVIDEAVSLAKLLSTEESGRFVNGLLGRIARERTQPSKD